MKLGGERDRPPAAARCSASCSSWSASSSSRSGLLSELVTSQHRERLRALDDRRSRLVDEILAVAALKALYFGTYDRTSPAQHPGRLVPAPGGGRGRRAPPPGLGPAQLVGRRPPARADGARGARASARRRERRRRRRRRRLPGSLRPARRRGGSRADDPSSSTRSSRCTTRWSATGRASAPAPRRRGVLRGIDRAAFRSADLVVADTAAHAAYFRRGFRPPGRACRRCPRRRRGTALRARMAPPGTVPRPLRRQVDPPPRRRDDPRGGRPPPGVPFRVVGDGQLSGLLDERPANVEHVPWIPYHGAPRRATERAGCALGIFGTGAEGGTRDPEQGVPGARVRRAGDHRRHAGRAGAPQPTAMDALLVPAGDPEALAAAVRRIAGIHALARRLADGGRATYEAQASEEVLGAQWRSLLERAARAAVIRPAARCAGGTAAFGVGSRRARRPPASRVLDRPLRRREPRPGRVVDGARRLPVGDGASGPAVLAARRALRPARRRFRAALVAVARPVAPPRRAGGRGRAGARAGVPPRPQAPRIRLGRSRVRARVPPPSRDAVARRSTTSIRSRSRPRFSSGASGSSTRDRLVPFAPVAALACLTKEQIGLVVAAMGLWYAFRPGRRRAGLAIALAGAVVSLVAVAIVVPHFAPGGGSPFASRYDAVGGSPGGMATTTAHRPGRDRLCAHERTRPRLPRPPARAARSGCRCSPRSRCSPQCRSSP